MPLPAFIPALVDMGGKIAGSAAALKGLSGSGGFSGGGGTIVDVQQKVAQNQTVNIGSQSDIADQLSYLLGQAPITEYPQNTGADNAHIGELYSAVMGYAMPQTGGVADSRYSPLTGGLTPKKSGPNLNQILIYGGLAVAAWLLLKRS